MNKSTKKILSLILMSALLFSFSGDTFAQNTKDIKLQKIEARKQKWLTLSESSKKLTDAQRGRIIKKLEKIRKQELSQEAKQKMETHQKKRKELHKKIKEKGISKEERKSLREELKAQKKQLKEINAQLKIDLKSNARRSLSGKELNVVEDMEPNVLMELQSMTNDPLWGQQWALSSINAPDSGYRLLGEGERPIVAVIDAGVDFSHEDLAGAEWRDANCVDENNEPIEGGCLKGGWDFLDGDDDPFPSDHISHGTSVAGVIGAVSNNEKGIASNGNGVQIMSLRSCCTAEGYFPTQGAAEAVRFAVNNGAEVINASFGGPTPSSELEEALAYARDHNVMVVAAAGNYGSDNDIEPFYPANYDLGNIISVAAHDVAGNLSWFSNYGESTVDIAAPGQDVLSLLFNDTYGSMSGTSFSAPFVTSVLAGFGSQFAVDHSQNLKDLFFEKLEKGVAFLGKVKDGVILRFASMNNEVLETNNDTDSNTNDTDEPGEEAVVEEETETNAPSLPSEDEIPSSDVREEDLVVSKTIFISDDEAEYSGNWKTRKRKGDEGGHYHLAKTKVQKKKEIPEVVWNLENIEEKKVRVNVSWVAHSNSSDRAKYVVVHDGKTTEVVVDQRKVVEEIEADALQHFPIDKRKGVIKRIRERIRKIRGKIKEKRGKEWSGWFELGAFENVTAVQLVHDESQAPDDVLATEIEDLELSIQGAQKSLKKEKVRTKKRVLQAKIRDLRKKRIVLRAKLKKIKKRHPQREMFLTADDLMIEVLGEAKGEDPEDPTGPPTEEGETILSEEAFATYTGDWVVTENQEAQGGTSLVYEGAAAGEVLELSFGDLMSQTQMAQISPVVQIGNNLQVITDWSGKQTLYVSWTTGDDRADAIPYTLAHAGGVYDFVINQRLRADQETVGAKNQWSGWYEVGDFVLDENSKLSLTTVDNSDGVHKIVVDEFRLTEPPLEEPQDPICGNGDIEVGEMCDDGNLINGDGCSDQCVIENTGGDTPVIPVGDGILIFHHSDHLTGANVDTDVNGLVVNLIDYYPFGATRIEENNPSPQGEGVYANDYKFTGKELDDETGFYYYGARYYDPALSRFVSRDTWEGEYEDPQSLNRYSYVRNNPLKYVDPSGNFRVSTGEVEKGDTMSSITDQMNSYWNTDYSYKEISSLNKISNPDKIYAGDSLIPNDGVPERTQRLMGLMRTNSLNKRINNPFYFAWKVRPGGLWDLKNEVRAFKENDYQDGFVFMGRQIRSDDPGNIHYGYVGASTDWASEEILLDGAGVAQFASDIVKHQKLNWGDNDGDADSITYGIQLKRQDDLREKEKSENLKFNNSKK